MAYFGKLYLDKEKDIIVELDMREDGLFYTLRTPNHSKGNLIRNLASLCSLELSSGDDGLKVIRGEVPCYIDERNREVYVLRLADTKVANIYPDGIIERKAYIPAISKTLMSQTKDYNLNIWKTLVKTYIRKEYKFKADLHTHMNANLDADLLIALGIFHQIKYPLYYIKKLGLKTSDEQAEKLEKRRKEAARQFKDSPLSGKYLTRKIDDHTFINFADLILGNLSDAEYNIPKIRASLTILKDGQAVFTNLEKVYLYRYVFTKGTPSEDKVSLDAHRYIPDDDIADAVGQMITDSHNPVYSGLSLFQNKLLWIARSLKKRGVIYTEISDTSLVKPEAAINTLAQAHAVLPQIRRETGVTIRFLAAIRRIPLTIVRSVTLPSTVKKIGRGAFSGCSALEHIDMSENVSEIGISAFYCTPLTEREGFVIRIHAGENDSLRDNVQNSLACVKESLAPNQKMPRLRIGHGLYTANLSSPKGKRLIEQLRESKVVLEFQLTSNVRLNNLSSMSRHPLTQYLRGGVWCVQGTDGGAIYGTDSIDEQLAMERLLDLSYDDMLAMKKAESGVIEQSMCDFEHKSEVFGKESEGKAPEEYLSELLKSAKADRQIKFSSRKQSSAESLSDQIRELPTDKAPIILLGGSFNSSRRYTKVKPELVGLLQKLCESLSPDDYFFVIGNRLSGYERELMRIAGGRFEIFAIVPTEITPSEVGRIRQSGVGVRVSIEPTRMGLYKSFAYEIFKRRPSVVLALDGNSAGANTVQEAKNGKKKARIFVNRKARALYAKARAIQGYVSLFDSDEKLDKIIQSAKKVLAETRDN